VYLERAALDKCDSHREEAAKERQRRKTQGHLLRPKHYPHLFVAYHEGGSLHSRAESPTAQSTGLQPCVAIERSPRPERSLAVPEYRFARGTFIPHPMLRPHRAEALCFVLSGFQPGNKMTSAMNDKKMWVMLSAPSVPKFLWAKVEGMTLCKHFRLNSGTTASAPKIWALTEQMPLRFSALALLGNLRRTSLRVP